jgi:hypothetical protein
MADDKSKKMAAALAGVNAYMVEEEEIAAAQAEQAAKPAIQFSPWAMSGRQEMMTMRTMLQLKAFSRLR